MLHTRMTTLAFFLLELSPHLVFEFDFLSDYNLNTLHNILMIRGRNKKKYQYFWIEKKKKTKQKKNSFYQELCLAPC